MNEETKKKTKGNLDKEKESQRKSLYSWQKIIIWIIGIFTFIAVTANALGGELNFGYFIDLVLAVGINVLILQMVFRVGNWICRSIKRNKNE